MTRKDNILQELSELNSTLATTIPQNPYTVPVGYFDGLSAQVLNRIKAMEAANAVEELGYLSPMLTGISKQMPYAVPQGYFEGLAEKAMQSISESSDYQTAREETETLSPLLNGLEKQMPYTVPQGYFEGLAGKVLQAVNKSNNQTAKEELETLSPLLSGLKKEMPFSVPQGYFESLTENISKEESKPAAKVISITSRKWFRYAAAAVIIGIVVTTGLLFLGGGEKEPGGKALAKFTNDVKKMDDTQKDNLIDFIDAGMNGDETAQVSTDNKSAEVKNLLQGISDDELKDFQEQTEDIQDVLIPN